MTISVTDQRIIQIREQRQKVKALHRLFDQLRQLVKSGWQASQEPLSTYARHLGVNWRDLKNLVELGMPICSPENVTAIGKTLNQEALASIVIRNFAGLSDKLLSLTMLKPDTINLIFDLREEYMRLALPDDLFLGLFNPHEEVIEGVVGNFWGKKSKLEQLEDESLSNAIQECLTNSNFDRAVQAAQEIRREREDALKAKGQELAALIPQFRELFHNRDEMAKQVFGVNDTTLRAAVRGEAGKDTYHTIFARVEEYQRKSYQPLPANHGRPALPSESDRKPLPVSSSGADLSFAALAGAPSPLGTPYALRPENFRQLTAEVDALRDPTAYAHFLDFVAEQVNLAAGLLNIAAQIRKPHEARSQILAILDGPAHEMHMALEVYASRNPGPLTQVMEDMRTGWASQLKGRQNHTKGV